MGVLIDASVLIDHERGRTDLERHITGREDEALFLSVITVNTRVPALEVEDWSAPA